MTIEGIIFDLGGTLVDWPDWDTASEERWGMAYDRLQPAPESAGTLDRERPLPPRPLFVQAMRAAELAHWERVEREHWSGPPSGLLLDGFERLGYRPGERLLLAVLDAYAGAVEGWAEVFPDSRGTLERLRARGLPLGLLSNTWWAAAWHDADLAAHGLAPLLDVIVYTSDLPHSKPHPSVFRHVAGRLGVAPERCLMVGDRPIDDIEGALGAGMLGVLKTNGRPRPMPGGLTPTAVIDTLAELPPLLDRLG